MSKYANRRVTMKVDLGKKCVEFQKYKRHAASKKQKRQEKTKAAKLKAKERVTTRLPNELVSLRAEIEELKKENQSLREQVEKFEETKTDLQQAKDKLNVYEDAIKQTTTIFNTLESTIRTDWSKTLRDYIEDFQLHISGKEDGGYRVSTPNTYLKWLKPWVEFLEKRGNAPSTMLIKEYLDLKWWRNPDNYNRIGRQIVAFTNEYVNVQVHLIKARAKNQPIKQHAKMKKDNYTKIKKHIEGILIKRQS